jgi:hypothetical protein
MMADDSHRLRELKELVDHFYETIAMVQRYKIPHNDSEFYQDYLGYSAIVRDSYMVSTLDGRAITNG